MDSTEFNQDYKPDVKTNITIKRGDIYLINLDENPPASKKDAVSLSKTGLISKTRPCLVISSEQYNAQKGISFRIAPIKSNNTHMSSEEYIRTSLDVLVPIKMVEGEKFIVINQTRPITLRQIEKYIATVNNDEIMRQVDREIIKLDTGLDYDKLVSESEDAQYYNFICEQFGDFQTFKKYCSEKNNTISAFKRKYYNPYKEDKIVV